jgi:hypothetical protein
MTCPAPDTQIYPNDVFFVLNKLEMQRPAGWAVSSFDLRVPVKTPRKNTSD